MKAKLDARLKELEKEADRCRQSWVGEVLQAIFRTLSSEDLNTIGQVFERLTVETNTFDEVLARLTEKEAAALERFNTASETAAVGSKGRPLTRAEMKSITVRGHKHGRSTPTLPGMTSNQ